MPVYVSNNCVAWELPRRIGERFLRGVYVLDDADWKIVEATLEWPDWRTSELGETRKKVSLWPAKCLNE